MSRPPRIPNWLSWDQSTVYFLTFGVADRKPVLANERAWAACCQSFEKLNQWTVPAAVVMPDHLHLLAAPKDRDASVAQFWKWFKRWFSAAFSDCRPSVSDGEPRNWQWPEGWFNRLLRSDESASAKWHYIRDNPVRAGLVQNGDDWPYQVQSAAAEW